MQSFESIFKLAAERHGGVSDLCNKLTPPKSASALRKITDDRWLSQLTKCIFQAGFKWQLIEDKWARFEEVFEGFDVGRWSMMSDSDIDRLLKTDGIVRNYAKIRSVGLNALYLQDLIDRHGGVGQFFATWKLPDYASNMHALQKASNRLGGKTGQIFLRRMGVDTLVFTHDMVKRLTLESVLNNKMPSSKKQWAELQAVLDLWHAESGYSLNEMSQVLAFSID